MVVTTVFAVDVTPVRAEGEKYSVNFGGGSWNVGGVTVIANKNGTIEIGESEEIELTGFDAATMEVVISASGGFRQELNVTSEGKTSLANRGDGGLPAGTLTFVVQSKPGGGSEKHMVNFGGGSWNVGGVTVIANKNGTIEIGESEEIELTGFDAATMEVVISLPDGFRKELNVTSEGRTSLANRGDGGLPSGTLDFAVNLKSASPVSDPILITVSVESGSGLLDGPIAIDGKNLAEGKVEVNKNATHEIVFQVAFGSVVSNVNVNGSNYTITPLLDGKIKVSVPEAEAYTVNLTAGDSDDVTIVWAYDKTDAITYYGGEDAWVEHGRVEVVSIKRGDNNVTEGIDINEKGGYIQIKKGDDVTLKLIPDYGYQLASATVNGQTFIAKSNVSEFNLPNIQDNLHFSGAFVEAGNDFAVTSSFVSGPDIINGQNAASSGNLKLTVDDNGSYSTDVTSKVEGENVYKLGSIDITLDNIVSKGTSEPSYWTQNITSFEKDIDIAFSIDYSQLSEGEEFAVVRDHNGTLEELQVNMDPEHGMISFPTNQFSTYTIVKKVVPKPDITDDMWVWDSTLEKYKYVIDDNNPCDDFTNIYVPTDKVLIIAKDYEIVGNLTVDIFGTLQIEKGCKLTKKAGANLEMKNLATLILGDDSSKSLFSPLKVKKTGHQELLAFEAPTYNIDNTEFTLIDGNYIYYDGPDSGFNLNTNGTIVPKDEQGNDLPRRGTVDYKVTTDGEVVASGTLLNDWDEVNILPEKFKIGTKVEFTVHVNSGYKLQTNGVRFPNNKNTISRKEDEEDGDSTVTCSYTLDEEPSGFLGLTVDFIEPGKELKYAEFYWSYDSDVTKTDDGWGKYIEHGTVEIISVTKNGSNVTKGTLENPPYWSTGNSFEQKEENGIRWKEKVALFEEGTTVVARLIPDRGYQLTRFNISNIAKTTRAVDGVNEYTFYINRPDFYHLSAVFSPVEDAVDSSATGVSGGNVTFAADEIANGTMALNVSDATPSTAEMNKFNAMAEAGGYEVSQCLNLESEQRFYKGVENATRDDCWVINKSELSKPATITLDISGITGDEVVVLHNHNGVYEEISATYSNGKLTFAAQSFSDFAIATKVKGTTPEPTPTPSVTPSATPASKAKEESNTDNTPVSTSYAGNSSVLETSMLIKDINATVAGNTLTIDRRYNRQYLTNAEMKALLSKGTIALRMQFSYNGVEYDITIPAGLAVNDGIPFYGPLYLAGRFPATKLDAKTTGSNVATITTGKATKGIITGKYIVRPGDNMYKIARKFSTSLSDISQKNPQIKNINRIYPGQFINI